jgi:hypothetical protein
MPKRRIPTFAGHPAYLPDRAISTPRLLIQNLIEIHRIVLETKHSDKHDILLGVLVKIFFQKTRKPYPTCLLTWSAAELMIRKITSFFDERRPLHKFRGIGFKISTAASRHFEREE